MIGLLALRRQIALGRFAGFAKNHQIRAHSPELILIAGKAVFSCFTRENRG
jgi:hypothetical protein